MTGRFIQQHLIDTRNTNISQEDLVRPGGGVGRLEDGTEIYVEYLGGESEHRRTKEMLRLSLNKPFFMKAKVLDMRSYEASATHPKGDYYIMARVISSAERPDLIGTTIEVIYPRDRVSLVPFRSLAELSKKYQTYTQLRALKENAETHKDFALDPGYHEEGIKPGVQVRESGASYDSVMKQEEVPYPFNKNFREQRDKETKEDYKKSKLEWNLERQRALEKITEDQKQSHERARRRAEQMAAITKRSGKSSVGGRRRKTKKKRKVKKTRKRRHKKRKRRKSKRCRGGASSAQKNINHDKIVSNDTTRTPEEIFNDMLNQERIAEPDQFAWTREIWNPDEPWTWRRLFNNGVFHDRQELYHFLLELFLPHTGPMDVEVLGHEAPFNRGKVVDVINDRIMIVEMQYPNDEGEIIVNPFNVIPLLS